MSGPQNYSEIKPFSSLVTNGTVVLDCPRYSVTYLAIEGSATGCLEPNLIDSVNLCDDYTELLDASVSANASYIWSKNGNIISDEPQITISSDGLYSVEIEVDGCDLVKDSVNVSSSFLSVISDTVCVSGDIAFLEISGNGDYDWYDAPNGGQSLSSSQTYSPVITKSTSYYIEEKKSNFTVFGKSEIDGLTYNNTGLTAYDGLNRTTNLSVTKELKLSSVSVFVHTDGANVVLNINGPGNYYKSFEFNELSNSGDGKKELLIDETLPPGDYVFDLKGTVGGVKVQYSNASNQLISDYASFETGGNNSAWYGMFFFCFVNFIKGCQRNKVDAILNTNSIDCITATDNLFKRSGRVIFPNPSDGVFNLYNSSPYKVFNAYGVILTEGESDIIDISAFPSGLYHVWINDKIYKLLRR